MRTKSLKKNKINVIVIDNFFFGISTVGKNGFESQIVFPNGVFRN